MTTSWRHRRRAGLRKVARHIVVDLEALVVLAGVVGVSAEQNAVDELRLRPATQYDAFGRIVRARIAVRWDAREVHDRRVRLRHRIERYALRRPPRSDVVAFHTAVTVGLRVDHERRIDRADVA